MTVQLLTPENCVIPKQTVVNINEQIELKFNEVVQLDMFQIPDANGAGHWCALALGVSTDVCSVRRIVNHTPGADLAGLGRDVALLRRPLLRTGQRQRGGAAFRQFHGPVDAQRQHAMAHGGAFAVAEGPR